MLPADDALLLLLDAAPLVPRRAVPRFSLGERVVVQRPRGRHAFGTVTRLLGGSGPRAAAEVRLEGEEALIVVPQARLNPATLWEGMGATMLVSGEVVTGSVQRVSASGRVCWIALDHLFVVRDADGPGKDRRYFAPNPTGALRQATLGDDGRWTLAGRDGGTVALGVRDSSAALVRPPVRALPRSDRHTGDKAA
jgi:hypothetical protein